MTVSRSQPKKARPITQKAIGHKADIAAKRSQDDIAAAHREYPAAHKAKRRGKK